MPNHITNILISRNTDALEALLDKDGNIDFNKIIPMPDYIINTVCGSEVEYEDSSIDNWEEKSKTRRPLTEEELRKGAGEGWYDWSKRNWGTKWNAYETKRLHYDIYSFQTAWCPPVEFLKAVSARFLGTEFFLHWKDEGSDGGMNECVFLNGVMEEKAN